MCHALSTFPVRDTSAELKGHCVLLSASTCCATACACPEEVARWDDVLGARLLQTYSALLSSRVTAGHRQPGRRGKSILVVQAGTDGKPARVNARSVQKRTDA